MSKEIYISSTPHETRLAIVENDALTEIYYERENEYTLAGSIYNGRVTRVLPGMQSSFVDIGLERDAFLYITDFMEEAPDSAEFDTSSNGDHAPRASGDSAPRASRSFEGERSQENAGRGGSDRSGRGRRGRERDRGADRPLEASLPGSKERAGADMPRAMAAEAERDPVSPVEFAGDFEVGEAAPGADGSRRWRGRRGRRRGRGSAGQTGVPAPGAAPAAAGDRGVEAEDEVLLEGGSFEEEPGFEIEAASSALSAERAAAPVREEGRRSEGRRGNGRREGQRLDPGRDRASDQRPQRAPRGFAPSRDLYAAGSGQESSTGPIANAYPDENELAAEPIVLPGESLSKYRKGEEPAATGPAADAAPITPAPPANLYTIAAGWDGGATLPGETLSRRRPAESGGDSRGGGQRDRQRDFSREGRGDRSGRQSRPGERSDFRKPQRRPDPPAAAVIPRAEDTVEERSAATGFSDSNEVSRETDSSGPETAGFAAPQSAPEAALATPELYAVTASEPVAQETPEYEPSDASASYRVDPLPRSEYRQSAPVLDAPAETAQAETPVHESLAHSVTPAPDEVLHPLQTEASGVAPEPLEQSGEVHDITSISAAGEMHSEPPEIVPETVQHLAPMEARDPASPMVHEHAVGLGGQAPYEPPVAMTSPREIRSGFPGGFAPGSGDLAEEIIDDEEFDGAAIQASSAEEMDDLQEETLEGAADLGTMLREMSIDNITRTSPEAGEEDDFEEDELDEDELDEEDEPEAEEGFGAGDDSYAQEESARSGSAAGRELYEAQFGQQSEAGNGGERSASGASSGRDHAREPGRDSERRGGRRDARRDGRRGRSDRGGPDRARSTGGSGDRERSGGNGHLGGRGRTMQSTNLPAISDLLKPGQEILVQIAKEPIAKKGARITSHIALPGRFLVFMPTVNHTGVSRKIESDGERRRLKEILLSEKGEAAGGFIVRTAASGASEEELRSDLRFLLNLWSDIKARSESSKSPALIYHDLNLIERILRDQVTDTFSAIWVDTETEYERVLRFLQRFQPSLIRRVKLYSKETPLFEQFGITEEINKALRSKVWLKSGGSIVINQTEALVAIDINTGKYVGKTARLEDTIVKTNLDAIPEIVRQIRLRDLGGIIIIDFIDMDERKNRNRVMAALEDELKNDRAPSKVLQFNDFGLVAITRKRVKQSLERTLSTTCNVCVGTGMVKSPITVCNDIYVEMRKMHRHLERGDVMLRVHPEVVKQLKTSGAKWLQEMEEMVGKTILVKSDPSLHPEQFDIH